MRISGITPQGLQATVASDSLLSQVVYVAPGSADLDPPEDTHLTFTLAATAANGNTPSRPAMTFRIPRVYVWTEHAYDAQGRLCRVPLRVQLPGATPWSEEPEEHELSFESSMPHGASKHQYIVNLGAQSGHVCRAKWLQTFDPMRSTQGLERPQLGGLEHHESSLHGLAESVSGFHEPASNTYFSSSHVTHEDSVVFFSCTGSSCKGHFGFDGRGASLQLHPVDLAHWADVIDPIRTLIRSFVVRRL
jgi:hypothetical protein